MIFFECVCFIKNAVVLIGPHFFFYFVNDRNFSHFFLSEIVFELVQVLPSVYLLFTRKYCIWNYLSVMSFVIILIEV